MQDLLPCHKNAMKRQWQDKLEDIDRKASERKEKSERLNKPGRLLKPLHVGDRVVVQHCKTKKWDRYGIIQECHPDIRRYIIRCESGMLLKRNRIHLRLRFSDTSKHRPNWVDKTQEAQPVQQDRITMGGPIPTAMVTPEVAPEVAPAVQADVGPATSPTEDTPRDVQNPVAPRRSTRDRKKPERLDL